MYNSISSVPLTSFCGMHPSCFSSARKVPKGNLTDGLFPTMAKREGKEKDHHRNGNAAIHGRCSLLFSRCFSVAKWFVPFFYCLPKTIIQVNSNSNNVFGQLTLESPNLTEPPWNSIACMYLWISFSFHICAMLFHFLRTFSPFHCCSLPLVGKMTIYMNIFFSPPLSESETRSYNQRENPFSCF